MKLTPKAIQHASKQRGNAVWPLYRCSEVLEAFEEDWADARPLQVYRFIERAATFRNVLKAAPRTSPKSVRDELWRASKTAMQLANQLEAFSNSTQQAFKLGVSGANAHKPNEAGHPVLAAMLKRGVPGGAPVYPKVPSVHAEMMFLEDAQKHIRMLQIKLQIARESVKVSRTDRLGVENAADLARFLFLYWHISFGKSPSVIARRRFHKVVDAIAPVYGLRVGSRIIRKANLG